MASIQQFGTGTRRVLSSTCSTHQITKHTRTTCTSLSISRNPIDISHSVHARFSSTVIWRGSSKPTLPTLSLSYSTSSKPPSKSPSSPSSSSSSSRLSGPNKKQLDPWRSESKTTSATATAAAFHGRHNAQKWQTSGGGKIGKAGKGQEGASVLSKLNLSPLSIAKVTSEEDEKREARQQELEDEAGATMAIAASALAESSTSIEKRLQAISKIEKKLQVPSKALLITKLPSTVIPDDIRRMAVGEDETTIQQIIYHRNQYQEFLNKITVVFRTEQEAVEFIAARYGKILSGHRLGMTLLNPAHASDSNMMPPILSSDSFSGQSVLISGLPLASRPDHLRTEFRKFQLMDTTEQAIVPVESRKLSTTCQYLLRLGSTSEAYRFVRTYHNTFFRVSEFRKRCPIRVSVVY